MSALRFTTLNRKNLNCILECIHYKVLGFFNDQNKSIAKDLFFVSRSVEHDAL